MVLDQKEKNKTAHKIFLASTDLSQAGTYMLRGNYGKTYDNIEAVVDRLTKLNQYLKVHIED